MNELAFTAASFDSFCSEKKLMASKCKKCGAIWLPPRPLCLNCKGEDMEWVELSGKGKIVSFTTVGVGTPTMIEAGYDRKNPYCSGVIELEEGCRMSAQILGVDVANPENIKIGTPVTVDFIERGNFSLVPAIANVKKVYAAFKA